MQKDFQIRAPIRVLIVDDQIVIRQGLRSMLTGAEDIEIVGTASDAEDAIKQAMATHPEIVLLDIRMPGMNGLRLLQHFGTTFPEIKAIILTNYDEEEFLLEAFRAGAYGYLLKNVDRETLLDALRTVKAGKRMLSHELVDSVLRQYTDLGQKNITKEYGLSDEDIHLLKLVAEGATNREISEKLFWSETAVKRKLSDVFEKMDVTDRAQAIAVAIRHGLI